MNLLSDMVMILTNYYPMILTGVVNTLILAVFGTAMGIVLGLILATFRNQEVHYKDKKVVIIFKRILIIFAKVYVDIVRGTPMMVQAMVFFYGLAYGGIQLNPMVAGFLIISFNTAAYISEIIRSGLISLDRGQFEAARSLGLSQSQTMRKIIMPQVIKNTLPALMNELIVDVKDSSVLSVIGVSELFYMTKGAASQNYMYFQANVLTAIIYLILTKLLTILFTKILEHLEHKKRKTSPFVQSQTVPEVIS